MYGLTGADADRVVGYPAANTLQERNLAMVALLDLWFPILLSAVLVFVASSIMHMCLPIHKADYRGIPGEAEVLAVLRAQGLEPGGYVFPHCKSMKDMSSPETLEKYRQGPVGFLTVVPSGPCRMGKSLLQWFLYTVVIGVFVAYVASFAGLGRGAGFLAVFRLAGTVAILAYAVTQIPDSIWKGHRWTSTWKFVGDGIVYGLITGATFGWLWPQVTG